MFDKLFQDLKTFKLYSEIFKFTNRKKTIKSIKCIICLENH